MRFNPIHLFSKTTCIYRKAILIGLWMLLFVALLPTAANAQESTINIDSVSVVDENSIIIGWTLETDHEEGYIEIHGRTSGAHNVIATVPLNQSYFIDSGVNTNLRGYSYYVVAWQPNGDIIVAGDEAHQNVYLDTLIPDICARLIYLQWESYRVETTAGNPEPLPSPFENYRVSLSYNAGDFVTVYETGQQELAAIEAEEPGEYCFRIQVFIPGTEITASSNVICAEISFLPQPQFFLIRKASVEEDSNNNVELLFHADNTIPDPAYIIKRMNHDTGAYQPLDTIETSLQTIAYTDLSANASVQQEIYSIEVLDSCRTVVLQSVEVATVYLQASQVSPVLNELQWNGYNGWEQGVAEYIVQRRTGELAPYESIATLAPGTTSYTDDISFLEQDVFNEEIYYRLQAIEAAGNPFGFTDTVFSNTAAVSREVEIFVPNAFKPSSQIPENRLFKPVFTAFSPSGYSITLYNRWGQQVFSSDDYLQAWDGQYNGQEAPAGVYSWVLRFKDARGNDTEKRGTVLLLR